MVDNDDDADGDGDLFILKMPRLVDEVGGEVDEDGEGAGKVDEAGTVAVGDWSCSKRRTFIRVSPSRALPFDFEGWVACG